MNNIPANIKREINSLIQEIEAMSGITSKVTLDFIESRMTEIVKHASNNGG